MKKKQPKVHVGVRLDVELVERIDARVQEWRRALPGMKVTRTDLVTIALEAGLRQTDTRPPATWETKGDASD